MLPGLGLAASQGNMCGGTGTDTLVLCCIRNNKAVDNCESPACHMASTTWECLPSLCRGHRLLPSRFGQKPYLNWSPLYEVGQCCPLAFRFDSIESDAVASDSMFQSDSVSGGCIPPSPKNPDSSAYIVRNRPVVREPVDTFLHAAFVLTHKSAKKSGSVLIAARLRSLPRG